MWSRNSLVSSTVWSVLPTMLWVISLSSPISAYMCCMLSMVLPISSAWTSMSFMRSFK